MAVCFRYDVECCHLHPSIFPYSIDRVAQHSDKNRMQPSNLGVVLGPTLMRPREETMAALMNLKYQSVVVQMLIQEYDKVRRSKFYDLSNFVSF